MEFTADQYFAAIITALLGLLILYSGYLIGLRDLNEKTYELTDELNAKLAAAQQQIDRTRLENQSLRQQARDLAESIAELQSRTAITVNQQEQINRSANQLSMCAQVMDAMGNYENAKIQRLLASQLYDITQQKQNEQVAA